MSSCLFTMKGSSHILIGVGLAARSSPTGLTQHASSQCPIFFGSRIESYCHLLSLFQIVQHSASCFFFSTLSPVFSGPAMKTIDSNDFLIFLENVLPGCARTPTGISQNVSYMSASLLWRAPHVESQQVL